MIRFGRCKRASITWAFSHFIERHRRSLIESNDAIMKLLDWWYLTTLRQWCHCSSSVSTTRRSMYINSKFSTFEWIYAHLFSSASDWFLPIVNAVMLSLRLRLRWTMARVKLFSTHAHYHKFRQRRFLFGQDHGHTHTHTDGQSSAKEFLVSSASPTTEI